MSIAQLRAVYHQRLCAQVLSADKGTPNIADSSSVASRAIAHELVSQLGYALASKAPSGQTAGRLFEQYTRDFLQEAFDLLHHLRPGKWLFCVKDLAQSIHHRLICTASSSPPAR